MELLDRMKERFKDDPREVTTWTAPNGHVVIIVGKPNIKLLVKKTLEDII